MNRRQAIQQLSIMGLGLTLYPSCRIEEVPHYARVSMDAKQYKLFQQVAEAILPVDHITYVTPEPRSEFILTILNDCTPKEEIDKYLNGLRSFQEHLSESGNANLEKASEEELSGLFDFMAESKSSNENLHHFYLVTKNLARQHFTGCEKFMTEELKYEFVPGRYIGCTEV